MTKFEKSDTLCWTCQRSGGPPETQCPWFLRHRPVPGWRAVRRDVMMQTSTHKRGKLRYYKHYRGAINRACTMEHILSLSYGKDSLACLGAIEELGWPLDRIVHAEVFATDTIPADLPPMVEFKKKVDAIIKERWGIEVENYRAKESFENHFYARRRM